MVGVVVAVADVRRPRSTARSRRCPATAAAVCAGTCESEVGKVTGRWPEGLASPNSSEAMALPSSCPGYQASSTPLTEPSHGMVTAEPVLSTTTVLGLAAATAEIRRSSALDRSMPPRSLPSDSKSLTKTTATLDEAASEAAEAVLGAAVVADGDAAAGPGGDALQRGDRAAGVDRGAAAAGGLRAGGGVGADHRDRRGGGAERQHAAAVLQQHRALGSASWVAVFWWAALVAVCAR